MMMFTQLKTTIGALALTMIGMSAIAHADEAPKAKAKRPAAAATAGDETAAAPDASADADPTKAKKIKYKAGKQVDFDKQTIQGELRRPEISVVTGNDKTTDNGLLRLREDFVDRITAHAGEEVE